MADKDVMKKVLLIGHEARAHWLAEAIARSEKLKSLVAYMKQGCNNPGIANLSSAVVFGDYSDAKSIVALARKAKVDYAVISGEEILSHGIVDALEAAGIGCVGPRKLAAKIETSKAWTRELIRTHGISGNPNYRIFWTMDVRGMSKFMDEVDEVVVKPDGLTGGGGVMVQGDHFESKGQVLEICRKILRSHSVVVLEEKQFGQEFTMQFFCDGVCTVDMPIVQDNKRLEVGDKGPNTGSMGATSFADHSLPFLNIRDLVEAKGIVNRTVLAIKEETGIPFKGVPYGGFMATDKGVKLIEFNARFGDPEAMVLELLQTDFLDICQAITTGTLHNLAVRFADKAMVCKYLVPKAYKRDKFQDSIGAKIEVGKIGRAKIHFASVDDRGDGIYTTTSRSIAVTGIGETLAKAERIAERGIGGIRGPLFYRPDIGTAKLIKQRVEHMKRLRGE